MYEVTVTMSRPGYPPRLVGLSGVDDHTPEQMSELLLRAADAVQRGLDLPSSLAEVVAARGVLDALEGQLDELQVPPSDQYEGMTALTHRLAVLGDEVRRLRAGVGVPEVARREHEHEIRKLTDERDRARGMVKEYGTIINEVRRRLGVDPSTSDLQLSRIVGELTAERLTAAVRAPHPADQPCLSATMLRAVLSALELPSGPIMLGGVEHARTAAAAIAAKARRADGAVPEFALRLRSVLESMGLPSGYWMAEAPMSELLETVTRVADNSDAWISAGPKLRSMLQAMRLPHDYYSTASEDELSSIAARLVEYSDRWLALTPDTVARAVHTAMGAESLVLGGELVWVPWEALRPQTMMQLTSIATMVLHELAAWPRREDTERQRWHQALNRVRLDAGLPLRPVRDVGDELESEFHQVSALIRELRLGAGSSSVTPDRLARVLFESAREVSKTRGSEPMPIIEKSGWDEAHPNRRRWWLEVARHALDDIGVNVPASLLPVSADELARAIHAALMELPDPDGAVVDESFEDAPAEWNAWRVNVSQAVLDRLPSFAADKSAWPPVSPNQLARAMHEARVAATQHAHTGLRPPLWAPVPWEQLGARACEWFERVADIALSELPQIMRADAESEASFVANMDTLTAQLRQEIARLQRENQKLAEGCDELAEQNRDVIIQLNVALDSFRDIASVLGMSFGSADDVRALGETTATAVRQLKAKHDSTMGPAAWGSMYRGMLMSVADQLKLPAESIDDPKVLGEALRAELRKRSGVAVNICVPKPEDWLIELRPVGPLPGDAEGVVSAAFRPGTRVALEDGLFTARLHYAGPDPVRPDGELLLPSVTPEQLAKAWLETPPRTGPAFKSWDELPALHEDYVDHARRVIERLSSQSMVDSAAKQALQKWTEEWSRLARQGRKVSPMPGEAFTLGENGEPERFRASFLSPQGSLKGFRGGAPELDRESLRAFLGGSVTIEGDADAASIARVIESLSGGRVRASAAQDSAALLTQLRELGAHVRTLEAERAGLQNQVEVTELRTRNAITGMERQLAEALGEPPPDDTSDDNWGDMILKVSDLVADHEADQETAIRVAREHDEFTRGLARAVGELVLNRARLFSRVEELARFERAHRACKGAETLERELTGQLAEALGMEPEPPLGGVWPWIHLMSRVAELVRDGQNVQALSRKHCDDLRQALGSILHGWDDLIKKVGELSGASAQARRETSDRSQDLSRALGLSSGESWEDMIEIVTGRTSRAGTDDLAVNALAEIRRILGLHERLFPAGVVGAVRTMAEQSDEADQCFRMMIELRHVLELSEKTAPVMVVRAIKELRASWQVMEEWYPRVVEALGVETDTVSDAAIPEAVGKALDKIKELRSFRETAIAPFRSGDLGRMSDAVLALVEAAGIAVDGSMAHDVVVDKASDAAAILRSWPDVLRAVDAFEGVEVEQPDEVEPLLRHYAEVFYKADRRGSVTRAIERLLAAHRGEPLQDSLDTMYERLDKLIKNLFEPLREIGGRFEVKAADYVDKQRFAEHALLAFRKHEDGVRGALSAFDIGTPTLAEVPAMLEEYAKTYHLAGRYQAALHDLEILLSTVTGQPKMFDDASLRDRFALLVDALFEPVLEAGSQYGVKFEPQGSKQGYARHVLMRARNHVALSPVPMWASFAEQVAAKLESAVTLRADAEDPDFVQSSQYPEVLHKTTLRHAAAVVRAHSAALMSQEATHPLVMALQDNTFWAPDSKRSDLELVPHADGGVELRLEKGVKVADRIGLEPDELAPVGAALLVLSMHHMRARGLPAASAMPVIRKTPTMPQEWCYGPNAIDPDPGKRWHIGCGGEVLTWDDVDVCGDCGHQWEPDVDLGQVVEAAEQQETAVVEETAERDAAADRPDPVVSESLPDQDTTP